MKEYGHIIIPMIALVIVALMMWAIADRVVAGIDKANSAQDSAKAVLDKSAQVISSLDNLCSPSGAKPGHDAATCSQRGGHSPVQPRWWRCALGTRPRAGGKCVQAWFRVGGVRYCCVRRGRRARKHLSIF